VILAHFTGGDTSSVALIVGLALVVAGARMLRRGVEGSSRRRAGRMLVLGLGVLAAGLVSGFVHSAPPR
jgi:LPXTG-motif cell wall-anchored protein